MISAAIRIHAPSPRSGSSGRGADRAVPHRLGRGAVAEQRPPAAVSSPVSCRKSRLPSGRSGGSSSAGWRQPDTRCGLTCSQALPGPVQVVQQLADRAGPVEDPADHDSRRGSARRPRRRGGGPGRSRPRRADRSGPGSPVAFSLATAWLRFTPARRTRPRPASARPASPAARRRPGPPGARPRPCPSPR